MLLLITLGYRGLGSHNFLSVQCLMYVALAVCYRSKQIVPQLFQELE